MIGNMSHDIKIFDLKNERNINFLDGVIFPGQTHSKNIIEITTGGENLQNCDGLITSNINNFSLGVKTADCGAICFYDDKKYGILHVGWRGLVDGIIEKMLDFFIKPKIFVSPLNHKFEIQRDDCYERIKSKFADKYFSLIKLNDNDAIIFEFLRALKSVLPKNTNFDLRNTFNNKNLASWRRDHNNYRNYTVIYGDSYYVQ